MGKVTGFLEIDRRDRRYALAFDRIRHWLARWQEELGLTPAAMA